MSPDAPPTTGRRPYAAALIAAGVALLVLGVAATIGGILLAPLFVPGTRVIALSLAMLAAGALWRTLGGPQR